MRKLIPSVLLVAVAALAFPLSLEAQDIDGFQRDIREVDPQRDVVLKVQHIGEGLAYVYVQDVWYNLRCYQRQRFAKSMRRMWKRNGGSNVVVKDKTGTEVADFKIFGSDFDVRGCDD